MINITQNPNPKPKPINLVSRKLPLGGTSVDKKYASRTRAFRYVIVIVKTWAATGSRLVRQLLHTGHYAAARNRRRGVDFLVSLAMTSPLRNRNLMWQLAVNWMRSLTSPSVLYPSIAKRENG